MFENFILDLKELNNKLNSVYGTYWYLKIKFQKYLLEKNIDLYKHG